MIIGKRLKEARVAKKMSQEELGNILGVSKVSICGYERGTRTPNMTNFLELINILDLDTKYVLGQDVKTINEDNEEYSIKLAKEDFEIVEAIKKNRELYNMFCSNPKKTVDKIKTKLNL
ncbi:MAG: helix-turn-helix transcriptional regulator [Bacilli bacterium]